VVRLKVTISDVAREAGVSITTVSRVMNNNYPVNIDTREKVEKAIKKLDFTPNALARGLIQKRTNTIGVIVPSITNIYFTTIVSGLQDFLRENGFHILLCDTGERSKFELEHLKGLRDKLVDGIISIDPRTASVKSGEYHKISKEIPLVLVNGYNEGVKLNYVISDQASGTSDALNYLIALGHANIAFLRGQRSYSYDLKEEVYRKVLEKYGLPFKEENIIRIEKGNSIETTELAFQAFQKRLSVKRDRPTAVFCCNDWMGAGALHAAQKLKLTVPKDLSVVGYDNIIISEITMPKLTTVDQNMYVLGKTAAEQLYKLIKEPAKSHIKMILDTNLITRDSCAACEPEYSINTL
jgi:LacI family transcriptional regulator